MIPRRLSRRPWRREFLPLAFAVALPFALASVFPDEVFSFRPRDGAAPTCSCAFVTLTPEAERKAQAMPRTAWQTGEEGVRGLRPEMFAIPLGESAPDEVVALADRTPSPGVGLLRFEAPPTPPSVAAPAEAPLAPAPAEVAPPAFSRDELLTLPGW